MNIKKYTADCNQVLGLNTDMLPLPPGENKHTSFVYRSKRLMRGRRERRNHGEIYMLTENFQPPRPPQNKIGVGEKEDGGEKKGTKWAFIIWSFDQPIPDWIKKKIHTHSVYIYTMHHFETTISHYCTWRSACDEGLAHLDSQPHPVVLHGCIIRAYGLERLEYFVGNSGFAELGHALERRVVLPKAKKRKTENGKGETRNKKAYRTGLTAEPACLRTRHNPLHNSCLGMMPGNDAWREFLNIRTTPPPR